MKCMNMDELNGLWVGNDKFNMILACDLNGMIGYQSGMVLA